MTSPAPVSFIDTEIQLTRLSLAGSNDSQVNGSEKEAGSLWVHNLWQEYFWRLFQAGSAAVSPKFLR
jgi:hypothetical protein